MALELQESISLNQLNEEIERERTEIEDVERDAIATQLYPTFIRLLTTPKLNPLTRQVEGLHFDVERVALMTWRATEVLIQIGKETNKGRIDPLAPKPEIQP